MKTVVSTNLNVVIQMHSLEPMEKLKISKEAKKLDPIITQKGHTETNWISSSLLEIRFLLTYNSLKNQLNVTNYYLICKRNKLEKTKAGGLGC